ncbi:Pyruvate dehydrogenase E1 component [Streptomyces sp. KY75]|nr:MULTISPECIES: hypothetical protein [unclassified Streptomyces]CAD5968616.1 Pyruvate dehydrogenase E1 component [Streptomyces sp. KY70]CAD5975402.1 Pyruvate dehydrogenase E1 component [Streptomyces sp. KY75]
MSSAELPAGGGFLQELVGFVAAGLGVGEGSSYPHPRLMPDFWEFPTVSMGLGPLGAIYQARMNRYMEARGIADTSKSHVWAYLGDGEMDEPESLGQLSIAARPGKVRRRRRLVDAARLSPMTST